MSFSLGTRKKCFSSRVLARVQEVALVSCEWPSLPLFSCSSTDLWLARVVRGWVRLCSQESSRKFNLKKFIEKFINFWLVSEVRDGESARDSEGVLEGRGIHGDDP